MGNNLVAHPNVRKMACNEVNVYFSLKYFLISDETLRNFVKVVQDIYLQLIYHSITIWKSNG